ncbi:hypothetical protein B9K06_25945, partial [Bacillus sp. OG2]
DWETLAKEKKTNVDSLIPKDWILPSELLSQFNETTPVSVLDISNKFLNDLEIEITESYTVTQLLESLKTGKILSIDVIKTINKLLYRINV